MYYCHGYVASNTFPIASGSMHPQRRTKSESDVKHVSVSKPSRTDSQDSSSEEQAPNSRKPPEVCVCMSTFKHYVTLLCLLTL